MLSFHSHRSACSSVLPCLDAWQLNARRFPPHFWWHHCCYGRGRFVKKGVGGWIMLNPRFDSEILRFFSFFHSNTSTNSHGCHHSDEDEKPARVGRLDFFFLGGKFQPTWLTYWLGVRLGPSSSFIQEWWSIVIMRILGPGWNRWCAKIIEVQGACVWTYHSTKSDKI